MHSCQPSFSKQNKDTIDSFNYKAVLELDDNSVKMKKKEFFGQELLYPDQSHDKPFPGQLRLTWIHP